MLAQAPRNLSSSFDIKNTAASHTFHQQRVNTQTSPATCNNCCGYHLSGGLVHALLVIDASVAPGPAPAVAHHDELLNHVPVRLDGETAHGDPGRYFRRLHRQWQAADPYGEWLEAGDSRSLTAAERLPRTLLPRRLRHCSPHSEVSHCRRHKRYVTQSRTL